MKVFCFSGLGADERVFKFLKINYELISIPWIDPISNETIENYAKRISLNINTDEPYCLLGVSFGGVVAQEVSKFLNPQYTFVVSSIKDKSQIPLSLKVIPTWVLNLLPPFLFNVPKPFAYYLFGTKEKKLLSSILKDTNPKFVRWALGAFKNWESTLKLENVRYISGEKDRLFKPFKDAFIVKEGHHFMIVDKSEEIAWIINNKLVKS
jgi:hypothetical protein